MAHTILVAFCVTGCDSMEEAQRQLMRQLPSPDHPGVDGIECWWIAEDERHDGSDCDSAVFVDMGKAGAAVAVLRDRGLQTG